MTLETPPLPVSPATRFGAIAIGLIVGLAGLAVSLQTGITVHNDLDPTLAMVHARPPWLTTAGAKLLEYGWAYLTLFLPGSPRNWWPLFGALHLGIIAALTFRLAYRMTDGGWPVSLVASLVVAVNGNVLMYTLPFNSVAILSVTVLLWMDARLSENVPKTRIALALVAASRYDGAVLAVLLAMEPLVVRAATARLREVLRNLLVLVPVGMLWILQDYYVTGRFLGLPGNIQQFQEAVPQVKYGLLGMIRWLRGVWVDVLTEGTIVLAVLGIAALGGKLMRPAAVVLAAHHLIFVLLGMTGSVLYYRYFNPDIAPAVLLAVAGWCWIWKQFEGKARIAAALILLAAWVPGHLGGISNFITYTRENRRIESVAAILARCLLPVIRAQDHPLLVTPGEIRGVMIFHLRNEHLADSEFERQFGVRRRMPPGPVIWVRDGKSPEVPAELRTRFLGEEPCAVELPGYTVMRFAPATPWTRP